MLEYLNQDRERNSGSLRELLGPIPLHTSLDRMRNMEIARILCINHEIVWMCILSHKRLQRFILEIDLLSTLHRAWQKGGSQVW